MAESSLDAEALSTRYPDLVELIDIGDSWEKVLGEEPGCDGHDLMAIRLTNRNNPGTGTEVAPGRKPILFIQAAIHANEIPGPEILLRFGEFLLRGYGRNADATWLLDEHEIHLLPFFNPDGRDRAERGLPWRKNANNDYCPNTASRGADLNRNFENTWGCCGSSSDEPCDETYRGLAPASEPETRAVEEYLSSIFPDQWRPEPPDHATGVFIDLHSHGEWVFWPWFHSEVAPPNAAGLATLGRKLGFLDAYRAPGRVALEGSAVDYAYGNFGVASYLVELGTEFEPDCEEFETTIWQDNLRTLIYAAKVARTPYLTPSGPDITEIEIFPDARIVAGDQLLIRASADDSRFANAYGQEPSQNVLGIRVYVDRPPWRPGGSPSLSLQPVDGAYDSVQETAELFLDTSDLAPGRHTLYFRAKDADGAWGAVSAEFLWIVDPGGPVRRVNGRVSPRP